MSMYRSTVASDPNIRGAKPIPVLVAMAPVPVVQLRGTVVRLIRVVAACNSLEIFEVHK